MPATPATPATPAAAGLSTIASPDGTFGIVAMDQRNTLRRMLTAAGRPTQPQDMRTFKADVAEALMPTATGILLDPDFGVPAARATGLLGTCGLLVATDPAERDTLRGEPRVTHIAEHDASWVADMGGDALKFLVQLRPGRPRQADEPDLVAEVLEVVARIVEDCRAAGMPSVIENLIYRLPDEEELDPATRSELIIESARLLAQLQPDLLKLEYPGSPEACRRLADVVTVPWAVLSAGVSFDDFTDVLRISCDEGGASGFIAGRALWREAVDLDGDQRRAFLRGESRRRLEACREAIAGRARPWTQVPRG